MKVTASIMRFSNKKELATLMKDPSHQSQISFKSIDLIERPTVTCWPSIDFLIYWLATKENRNVCYSIKVTQNSQHNNKRRVVKIAYEY